jgi:serine/threonine-protein kinase RsbW
MRIVPLVPSLALGGGAGEGMVPAAAGSCAPAAAAGHGTPPATRHRGVGEPAGGGTPNGGLVAGLVEGSDVDVPLVAWPAVRGVPVAVRVFPGRAEQAGEARRWVRALLGAAGTCAVADAVLAAAELFSNAVVHTRSGLRGGTVTVAVTGDGTVHVHDLGSGWGARPGPVARRGDLLGTRGRGLPVVARVCAGWGTVPAARCPAGGLGDPAVTAGGCCVWCRLPPPGEGVGG